MPQVVRTRACDEDLLEIGVYIARDNPSAAEAWVELIDRRIGLLAEFPQLGRVRPELGHEVRALPVGSYLIIYRESSDRLEILRVLHGARNLPEVLNPADDADT